jgi:hypothetical protein
LLLAAGCACPRSTTERIALAGDLRVRLLVETVRTAGGTIAHCEIVAEVLDADSQVVLFFDPALPTVLCTPDGTAEVLFGLSRMPNFVEPGMEVLRCRVMAPGFPYRRTVTLWNPLDEQGPYGNPWRDAPHSGRQPPNERADPDSPAYDDTAWRRARSWQTIRVRVAYFDLKRDAVVFTEDVRRRLLDGHTVEIDNWALGVLDAQREVCLSLDVPVE